MKKAHLLIVDESTTLVDTLAKEFQDAGYDVSRVYDGSEAIHKIEDSRSNLVLIGDLPVKLTGMHVIEWMRREGIDTLLITIHNSDELHVRCPKSGGDDYLVHPVSSAVILAHVEIRLKNNALSSGLPEKLHFDDIEIDTRRHRVHRGSRLLMLTPKEYNLLVLFLKHPQQVLHRDQITEHVWGSNFEVELQIVDAYVSKLRKKLELNGEKRLIHTERGFGYILRYS